MRSMTTRGFKRHLNRGPVIAGALLATFAATALATGNSIHIHVPGNPTANQSYTIKLRGHAEGTKDLYIIVDYKGCAPTPAQEYARAKNGVVWRVQGDYVKSVPVKTPRSGTDHACAYLVKKSVPRIANRGVVDHRYVTYTVH